MPGSMGRLLSLSAVLQMESTLSIQALKPRMDELKAKYENEPETLQLETARLYKAAGVNPLAGCLPTLATIPVFIGLYRWGGGRVVAAQRPVGVFLHKFPAILLVSGLPHASWHLLAVLASACVCMSPPDDTAGAHGCPCVCVCVQGPDQGCRRGPPHEWLLLDPQPGWSNQHGHAASGEALAQVWLEQQQTAAAQ